MLEVTPLASGSDGNAILLADGPRRLLLDCGLPFRELQESLRYRAHTLDAVLLTHAHQDHARGVSHALALGVPTFATRETLAALDVAGHHHAHAVEALVTARAGVWRFVPVPASHDGAEGAVAFIVSGPSGDTAAYVCDTAFVHHRFAGVTHWLVEANYDPALLGDDLSAPEHTHIVSGHMSIEQTLALLGANDLSGSREIWLLHLSDRHSDAEGFRRRVAAATGLPVYVAPSRAEALASRGLMLALAGGQQ